MPQDTSSIVPASCDVLWFELLVITAGHRALTARVIIVTDDGYRRRTHEVFTRPKSRPQRGAKSCQRQEASCKHAESRPIHIAVNDKTPERTFAE